MSRMECEPEWGSSGLDGVKHGMMGCTQVKCSRILFVPVVIIKKFNLSHHFWHCERYAKHYILVDM